MHAGCLLITRHATSTGYRNNQSGRRSILAAQLPGQIIIRKLRDDETCVLAMTHSLSRVAWHRSPSITFPRSITSNRDWPTNDLSYMPAWRAVTAADSLLIFSRIFIVRNVAFICTAGEL